MTVERSSRRRRLLIQLVALLAVFSLVAAACGDDDDEATDSTDSTSTDSSATDDGGDDDGGDDDGSDDGTTPEPTEEPGMNDDIDPDGEIQFGGDFTVLFGTGFDPSTANAPGERFNELIYGTLLRRTADGEYHDGLASLECTGIVDPSTVNVCLTEGQSFTDGTPLTVDHVIAATQRNSLFNTGRNLRAGQLGALVEKDADGNNVVREASYEKTDDTHMVFNLASPIAGAFFDLLAHEETMPYNIPDVGMGPGDDGYQDAVAAAIQAGPIGAGPYKLKEGSYKENDEFILEKNPDYVLADMINIPTVIWRHITADSVINALNGGLLDYSPSSITTAQQVNRDGMDYLVVPNPDKFGWLWTACMSPVIPGESAGTDPRQGYEGEDVAHPLTIPEVRMALNFGLNKPEMIQQGLVGIDAATVPVMDQIWLNDDPRANPALVDSYPLDKAKAVELLAKHGFGPDNPLKLSFAQTANNTTGEILQAQWADINVELELRPTTNTVADFYMGRSVDFSGSIAGSSARFFTDKVTRNWTSGVGATCNPSVPGVGGDPEILDLITELQGKAPDDPSGIPLWHEIGRIIIEGAFGIFFNYPPDVLIGHYDNWGVIGHEDGMNGDYARTWPTQVGVMYPDMHQLYIKKS
jgi:ABC-type transport system substrate-binding protein